MTEFASLKGRVALVTGAGTPDGLGATIAHVLAERGAAVAVTDVKTDGAGSVASDITGSSARAIAVNIDVADEESVRRGVRAVRDQLGPIDILVNNAAVFGATREDGLGETSAAAWLDVLRVNVVGTVLPIEAVLPEMKQRRYGKIVNISSIASHASRGIGGAYPASKAAALRYTKGLARMLAPHGITVNAVCPGAVWTGMQEMVFARPEEVDESYRGMRPYDAFVRHYSGLTPIGRPQTAREVAVMAAFLASDDTNAVTGQCIHVDGGTVIE